MKKLFGRWAVGAILVAALATGAVAAPDLAEAEAQKQKVGIVVVEKKERKDSGSRNQSEKSHSEKRDKRP